MNLQSWADNGWLRSHKTSPKEIAHLLYIVDRDLSDVGESISPDWKFSIAYNAALRLCTMLLYASGFRAEKNLQHYRTIQSLPVILWNRWEKDAEYLEACRKKRNIAEYDYIGGATEEDAIELIMFVKNLRQNFITWFRKMNPKLLREWFET